MRVKFDLSGAVEKMTIFKEVEFGPEELGMIYEAQRSLVPEVLNFMKEMQKLAQESKKESEVEFSNLEKDRLESKIESLKIQLDGERKRHSNTKKNRDEYFDKYIKLLDENTKKRKENIENLKKENEELRKSLGIEDEEDDDELY